MEIIHRECPVCKKLFSITPSLALIAKENNWNIGGHCSLKCQFKTKRLNRTCELCKKKFWSYKRDVNLGKGRFCSRTCARTIPKQESFHLIQCLTCGKERLRYKSDIKRGRGKFCSRPCYLVNKKKTYQEKRNEAKVVSTLHQDISCS